MLGLSQRLRAVTPEAIHFHRKLICAALELFPAWERYAASATGPERELNEQLLRLAKGIVKAHRMFLIQSQMEDGTTLAAKR